MLWACVLLPQLALDGVMRRRADADEPLALLSGSPQRRILQTVNPAARALGLRPGQSLTSAHAMVRDFATAEYALLTPRAGTDCSQRGRIVSARKSA